MFRNPRNGLIFGTGLDRGLDKGCSVLDMNLTNVKPGDLVRVDKRGQRFLAEVTEVRKGEVSVRPEIPSVSYRSATAREVVSHYRKSKSYSRKRKV